MHIDFAYTDEKGRFEFPVLEGNGGEYRVLVYAPGYVDLSPRSRGVLWDRTVAVTAGAVAEVPPIVLTRANQWVAGIVVDPEGKPVEGAFVWAHARGASPMMGGWGTGGVTDKDGRFFISGLPNVPLEVSAGTLPEGPAAASGLRGGRGNAGGAPRAGPSRLTTYTARAEAQPGQRDVRIVLDPKRGVRGR
jgi:hypothetical protein